MVASVWPRATRVALVALLAFAGAASVALAAPGPMHERPVDLGLPQASDRPEPAGRRAMAEPAAALLTDPAGDVAVTEQMGLGVPGAPVPAHDGIDLTQLRFEETATSFRLELTMAGIGGDVRADAGNIQLRFTWGGCLFYVNVWRAQDGDAYFGALGRQELPSGPWEYQRGITVERDLQAGTIWATIDRAWLANMTGHTPGRGDILADFMVSAVSTASYQATGTVGLYPIVVSDVMPDNAFDAATERPDLTVQFGGSEGLQAKLASDMPFVASNGEATTHKFLVQASHSLETTTRFRFELLDVPDGWNVTLPGVAVDIPAGGPVEFPVYATVPFFHKHGLTADFTLRMQQDDGEAWASLHLGVDHLAIPQPAGHHNVLNIHSSNVGGAVTEVNQVLGGTGGWLSMNTLVDDPADTATPVPGYSNIGALVSTFQWSVCMDPALRMGLDFDLDAAGEVKLPVTSTRTFEGVRFGGRLLLAKPLDNTGPACYPDSYEELTELAAFDEAQDPITSATSILKAQFQANEAADRIPFEPGTSLVLELKVTADSPAVGGTGGVEAVPGGTVELPLVEYVDAVQVTVADSPVPEAFVPAEAPTKDSSGLGVVLLVGAVLVGAVALRRRV